MPNAGSGVRGGIPRGVEVLVKKASIDPEFRRLLLKHRSEAAKVIGLALDRSEAAMLNAVPAEQLEAIITRTAVPAKHRAAFLGRAAAAMLLALGTMAGTPGCIPFSTGIRGDPIPPPGQEAIADRSVLPASEHTTREDPR